MLPVSDRFLAALKQSHRVSVAATVLAPGMPPAAAQVISGEIHADRDARVRRQGSVTVAFDLARNLEYVRSLPFGGYVRLERGIHFPDGTIERPTIGVLRVDTVSWARAEGAATLTLSDRMQQVQDEPFVQPFAPAGLRPADAAVQAVHEVFGDAIGYDVRVDPADAPLLRDVVYAEDRAQAVGDLASSAGADAYFDGDGDFVLAPSTSPSDLGDPVWEFEVGAGGTLMDVAENLDRSAVRNGVAVHGQAGADTPPVFALAVDDDPASPTRWGGPFGKVVMIVNSTSMQSQEQADATAASLLNLRLGLARVVTLRAVPNPAIEPDDVVLACYPDGREEPLLVNGIALPLDVGAQLTVTATARYRPTTLTRYRRRRPMRIFGGAAAWRELTGARTAS